MDYAKQGQRPSLVKIKTYNVHQSGRGVVVTLPAVWADDLALKPGDKLDIYRDTEDRLVIVAAGRVVACQTEGGGAA